MKNGSQFIFKENIQEVKKTLKSSIICSGPNLNKFEKNLKRYLKSDYVTVCSSGTAALHLAFQSLEINKNDIVIIPNINFIASFNMLTEIGAKIIICDVDKINGQLCIDSLLKILKKNKKIKALVTMYLGGVPKNIEKLIRLKNIYKFKVIEDACHAFGSSYRYQNKKFLVGNCSHFECSIFSFHALKTITSGEGGAISFKNKTPFHKSQILRSHGIIKKNHWDYDVILKGYNYRMDEISATLGNSQLNQINKILRKRRNLSLYYNNLLKDSSEFIKIINNDGEIKNSACHLFIINVYFEKLNINKSDLINAFIKKKILLHSHYKPISLFSLVKYKYKSKLSQSRNYFDNSISLPLYYELSYENVKKICKSLINFLNNHKIKNVK
tara:strand:- start:823 stop:1977 length:1155 start_codon:yes stop_codon:yes gene_type:complete